MSETPMVEAVARAISGAPFSSPASRRKARAAIKAVRNHIFGDSFIIRHGPEPTAVLKGDVPQLILRHLIDLAMAEGPALAVPEEGRET